MKQNSQIASDGAPPSGLRRLWQPRRGVFWLMVAFNLLSTFMGAVLRSDVLSGLGVALVGAVYLVGQVIESMYLTPRLLGERIGLHPIAVIFALLAFGHLFGFVGVLIALPASAVLLVAIRRARTTYLNSPLYRESASDGSGRPDRPD